MVTRVRCPTCGATMQAPAAGNDRLAAKDRCPLCGTGPVSSLPATPASTFGRSGQLLDDAGQTVDALETMLDGCDAISSALDLERLLHIVAERMTEITLATFCRIALLDETGVNLRVRAAFPARDSEWHPLIGRQYALDLAPWHREVAQTGRALILGQDELHGAVSEVERGMLFAGEARSALLVPLATGDRVLGVASLSEMLERGSSRFTPRTVRVCRAVANLAAMALENLRLHETLRREVAQRKGAEKSLQETTKWCDTIIESIPSSLFIIDRHLRVVSANRTLLRETKRRQSETVGSRIEEVFSRAALASSKLEERIAGVFESGTPFSGGRIGRLPRLPERAYLYRLTPLTDEDGTVRNVVLLMDDVTTQKRLSQKVRRAERHLAIVVDSASDLVVSMDAEGRILSWNGAAKQTSGFEFGEVQGRLLSDLCVGESQQKTRSWLRQLARGQFTTKSQEIDLSTKEGRQIPISWSCSPLLDAEHRIVGIVAVGRDLTERKQLAAQGIKTAKLASLGVMAGGIAHEIRNPLAISSAAAQLLLERPDDAVLRKEAAKRIYSGIQRASYIIENLLKFARPPQKRMAPLDINEALEDTLSLLVNQLNLRQVEIEFADTGRGISKELLGEIFAPFFTTMPVGQGTGLGLSISYSIIKQHHGTIDVQSKAGVGSTFTIRLPVQSDEKENTVG